MAHIQNATTHSSPSHHDTHHSSCPYRSATLFVLILFAIAYRLIIFVSLISHRYLSLVFPFLSYRQVITLVSLIRSFLLCVPLSSFLFVSYAFRCCVSLSSFLFVHLFAHLFVMRVALYCSFRYFFSFVFSLCVS